MGSPRPSATTPSERPRAGSAAGPRSNTAGPRRHPAHPPQSVPAGCESLIVARHGHKSGAAPGGGRDPPGDTTAQRGDTVTIWPGTCGQRPAACAQGSPPGLSTGAHASSGAHTSRAIGTGHHGRPGHQAAITIHRAQLKDHLDNKIAEHNGGSRAVGAPSSVTVRDQDGATGHLLMIACGQISMAANIAPTRALHLVATVTTAAGVLPGETPRTLHL